MQLPIVNLKVDSFRHALSNKVHAGQISAKSGQEVCQNVNTKNKLNCKNLQLPIATFKNRPFQTCIIVKRTCIPISSKIGLVGQSKLCTQIYSQKFANCINLQLAIRISKIYAFRTCSIPSRTFSPILRSIGLLDNELPRKEIISTDDRRTDGRTDRRHARQTIGSFFRKKKKNTLCNTFMSDIFYLFCALEHIEL